MTDEQIQQRIMESFDQGFVEASQRHFVSFFELNAEYHKFVNAGGLDQTTGIVNEDFERSHKQALCRHQLKHKECNVCYRAPKPYFPGDTAI